MGPLRELVKAYNDVYGYPRPGRFDPRSVRRTYNPGASPAADSALIAAGARGFYEAVETERGRHNFALGVPGVMAFSMVAFLETTRR